MTSQPGATRLAAALRHHGSDLAFGVPGGGPNLDVVGALEASGIRFVLAHGETAACIMASVYGHLTGRPAAAVVTRGPGAASAVNGAAQATLDRHPLVLVTDTVPARSAERVPHQRIDQRAMFEPVCKLTTTLTGATDHRALVEAVGQSLAAPAGTVHLDHDETAPPSGVESALDLSPAGAGSRAEPGGSACRSGTDLLAAAGAMVAAADRPLIIAGLGAAESGRQLVDELERFGAPVLTTYQAVGVVPSEHRLSAGLFTNGASERPIIDRADLIVTVGLDPVEPIPAPWSYDAPVVSLTAVPTADPYLPIELELVGDPVQLLQRALVGDHRWPPDAGSRHRRAVLAALARPDDAPATSSSGLTPVEVVTAAAERIPRTSTTTVDAGAHFLAVMPFWPVDEPKRLLISNGLATMGYALPAAIAAALARPDEPVLCFVGDGGLGMTLAELETVARLELPITVVVFNDSALSLIRIKQQPGQGGSPAVAYRYTDFAAMAPALGLAGTAVSDGAALARALERGWDEPRLIDVAVDPDSYRHLLTVTRG